MANGRKSARLRSTLALLCSVSLLAHIAHAAAPISIAPLAAPRSGTPSVFTGAQDPNPSVPSKWEIVQTSPGILGIHTALVPGTDKFLFVGRASPTALPAGQMDEIAGVYDYAANSFVNVTQFETSPFCAGLSMSSDGRVLVVGGNFKSPSGLPDGRRNLRFYSPSEPTRLREAPVLMRERRWYPTATLLPDQRILINGGTRTGAELGQPANFYESWTPLEPNKTTVRYNPDADYVMQAGKNFYPFQWVLPTGDVYVQIDSVSRFVKPDLTFRKKADGTYLTAPAYPAQWKTQFPRLAAAVMLPLTPDDSYSSVTIVVFGGVPTNNACGANIQDAQQTPANPFSYRMKISWTRQGADWAYTFSAWEEEDMGIPRVGGESVLLPNGDVVLLNGCQTGCVGGIDKGVNRGSSPAFWAQLYQPDRPSGRRYTVLQASTLARTYHGTGALTRKGTVVVAGCDACNTKYFVSNATFMTKVNSRREYRIEVFSPPYALDARAKPRITSVNGNVDANAVVNVTLGGTIVIEWAPEVSTETDIKVTSVVLVAPAATTHSFDANQRSVVLPITSGTPPITARRLTVSIPNNANLLPKQFYLLFLNNVKTHSDGRWVRF